MVETLQSNYLCHTDLYTDLMVSRGPNGTLMALSHNIWVGYPLDPQPHQSQFAHIIFKLK